MATDLVFTSEVTDEAVQTLLDKVMAALENGEDDFRLFLTTYGGELSPAFTFYDRLHALQQEMGSLTFSIIATGYCLSAGTLMLQAGTERVAYPHTVFMLHQPSQYPWEDNEHITYQGLCDRLTLQDLLIDHLADIYSAHCTPRFMEVDQTLSAYWRDRLTSLRQDFFTPDQALGMGLIDRVENIRERSATHAD